GGVLEVPLAHTTRDKDKLIRRMRRIRGQAASIERALTEEADCYEILQQVAACRGALNGFMAELLEGHIRCHILDQDQKPKPRQKRAAEEVIGIVHSYMK
ncbi:MAG TPA: metal/formaldehyde-sensitive transcriptional repressor, partial [Bryobacteraceae bacterium]|nr:metal/formaldehyde-sensitive transcriptional repressor [Bryobacteraceae bacterium]